MPKNKKLALDSGIQTNQILTKDDEVCIPSLSSILLAVTGFFSHFYAALYTVHCSGSNHFRRFFITIMQTWQ